MKNLQSVWLLAAAIAVMSIGCDKAKTPPPASNQKPDVSAASEQQAAVLNDYARQGAMSEGDKAWEALLTSMREPAIPESWQTNPPSKEEVAAFQKQTGGLAAEMAGKLRNFYDKFPDHEKAGEAREQEYQLLSLAAQLGDTNSATAVAALEEKQLKDPNLSEDDRFDVRLQQLQRTVMGKRAAGEEPSVAELESGARKLQKEFPKRPEVQTLLLSAAQGWLEDGQLDKSRELAKELEASESVEVKEGAAELLKKLDRVGKPLDLKFTAIDGRQVDLQAMRGKVVLVDFWATWCRPCLAELPNVKATYNRLNERGFEIVGISLDSDRAALDKVVARESMKWPQYFGEEGSGVQMAQVFGVTGIPAMWLVDKKGVLRDVNARRDLAAKVEKLLGEAAN